MRIGADRLAGHLAGQLASAYLITGDEPLLVDEALDSLRRRLREEGFTERDRYVGAAQGFDWSQIQGSANLSLFASRRIIELRIPTGKPGAKGAKTLTEFVAQLDADTCLIVIAPRLTGDPSRTAWVSAIEKAGVMVQVWPIKADRLPTWIEGRMRERGLEPEGDAVDVLVGRTEGNLLAADQEIDKLLLQNGPGAVSGADVARAVADSARFDVYDLSAAALDGDTARAVRVLDGLRAEGVAEPLVLWALSRELRVLSAMYAARAAGQSLEPVFRRHRVWAERKTLLTRAARRLGGAAAASALLQQAVRGEALVKGQAGIKTLAGDRWRAITGLVMGLCGVAGRETQAAL